MCVNPAVSRGSAVIEVAVHVQRVVACGDAHVELIREDGARRQEGDLRRRAAHLHDTRARVVLCMSVRALPELTVIYLTGTYIHSLSIPEQLYLLADGGTFLPEIVCYFVYEISKR